jgi:hypothetical protein
MSDRDIYRELSKLDLTDYKNHKDIHLKYILLNNYIEDLNNPSKYKAKWRDEGFLTRNLSVFITGICKIDKMINNIQAHEIVTWIYNDIIPEESKQKVGDGEYLHKEIDRLYTW